MSRVKNIAVTKTAAIVGLLTVTVLGAIVLLTPQTNAEDPNLLAAYGFNNPTTPLADSSSKANHLVCSTICPAYSSNGGHNGSGAYNFAGNNNWLAIPNESQFDFSNNFTVEFWMKTSSFTKTREALIHKGNSAWAVSRYSTTNDVSFTTFSPFAQYTRGTNAPVNNNVWHHVAVTYTTSAKEVYIDGVLKANTSFSSTISKNNLNVRLGFNEQSSAAEYGGWLDDVRIYSRALSQTEIQSDRNKPVNPTAYNCAGSTASTYGAGTYGTCSK